MRTTPMANASTIERKWLVVDAAGKTLGRLSSEVAAILRGKHKPTYTPHVDTGDHVIIINAEKIELTGKKLTDKIYYRHTQHPGGLKSRTALEMRTNYPEKMLEPCYQRHASKRFSRSSNVQKIERIPWF